MDLVVRGIKRHRQGDAAGAVADFDEALRVDPRRAEACCCRGVVRRSSGDLAGALVDFDAALEIDPRHAETYCNRAAARHASGDPEGALADLDAALEINPRLAVAYNNRGAVRMAQWQVTEALADFNEAIQLDPGMCLAYLGRGNARYHLCDPDSRHDYSRAFAIDAELTIRKVVDILVDACRRPRKALAGCARHLQDNPNHFSAYVKRAGILVLMGREDEARQTSEELLRRNPSSGRFLEATLREARRRMAGA